MSRFLLAFVLVLPLFGSVATAQDRIGFVDLEEVILRYKSTARVTRELEESLAERRNLVAQQRASLRSKQEGLESLAGDDLARLKLMKEIKQEEEALKIEEEWYLRQIEAKMADHIKKVYQDVLRTVQDLGLKKRYWAIFLVQKGEIAGQRRESVEANILVRPVLWYDPRLDLTAEVIQALNR